MKKLFYLLLVSALVMPACTPQSNEVEPQVDQVTQTSEDSEMETETEDAQGIVATSEPCFSTFNQGKNFSEESRTQNVTFDFPCGWKVNMVEDDGRTSELSLSSPDEKAILFTTKVKFGETGETGSIEIDGESYKTTTYDIENSEEMGVIVETKFGNFSYSYFTEEQRKILENIVKSVQYSGGEINPF